MTVVPVIVSVSIVLLSLLYHYLKRRKLNIKAAESVIVITGCDSGFGQLTSIYLAKQGFQVIASSLTIEGRRFLEDKVALSVVCDVTKEEDLLKLKLTTESFINSRENLKLWCLINNAGICVFANIDWASMQAYRKVFEVNFFAVVALTKFMLPLLKRNRNSRIINISSIAGVCGIASNGSYTGLLSTFQAH